MLKFVVHRKKKKAKEDENRNVESNKKDVVPQKIEDVGIGKIKDLVKIGVTLDPGSGVKDQGEKDVCSTSSQDSDIGSMLPDNESCHSNSHHDDHSIQETNSNRGSTRSDGSSRSSISNSTTDSKGKKKVTFEEKTYMLDSQQDSSSGIASDDHNGTNSESSPTLSSSKEHFPRLGQTRPPAYPGGQREPPVTYTHPPGDRQETYVHFQTTPVEVHSPHEPVSSKLMSRPRMGFATFHPQQQQSCVSSTDTYSQVWPCPNPQLRDSSSKGSSQNSEPHGYSQGPSRNQRYDVYAHNYQGPTQNLEYKYAQSNQGPVKNLEHHYNGKGYHVPSQNQTYSQYPQGPSQGATQPQQPPPQYPKQGAPPPPPKPPSYSQYQQRKKELAQRPQTFSKGDSTDAGHQGQSQNQETDLGYILPHSHTDRGCVYRETDLDEPHYQRNNGYHETNSSPEAKTERPQYSLPASPIRNCVRMATEELLNNHMNGYLSSNSDLSVCIQTDEELSVITRSQVLPLDASSKSGSYFDILPDRIVTRILSHFHSDELCRCARVSRRFYTLAWDPVLWTTIRVRDTEVDIDKALRTLTKRLSYETPTVCVMVERIILSHCQSLTDKGLLIIANRCPELTYLDIQGCPNISNIALFEVVSKCVNLETLNTAECAQITTVCLTPEATLQAATYGKQVYLRYLDMTDCYHLEDSGLQILASYCSQLVYLYLRRCTKITDIGVQYVANYCVNLKEFSISDCFNVTDFALRELAKLRNNLRYLSIAKCEKLTDIGVKYIAQNCHRLRYLNVRGCEAISDDSLQVLATSCPKLKSLDIGKCDITDRTLHALAANCPMLKKLSVKSCDGITDNGIKSLAQHCRHLQQLNIQDCNLTADAYRMVKKCCKRCIIEHTNPGFY